MKDIQKAHREQEAAKIMAQVAARFERTWGEALHPRLRPAIPALMRVPSPATGAPLKKPPAPKGSESGVA